MMKPINAVAYLRMSTDKQEKLIVRQRAEVTAYAKRHDPMCVPESTTPAPGPLRSGKVEPGQVQRFSAALGPTLGTKSGETDGGAQFFGKINPSRWPATSA
jgi:hypothetical protein